MEFVIIALIVLLGLREYSHNRAEQAHLRDRRELLQRIQRPVETAQAVEMEEMSPGAPSMPRFTDEEEWQAYNAHMAEDPGVLN